MGERRPFAWGHFVAPASASDLPSSKRGPLLPKSDLQHAHPTRHTETNEITRNSL